MEKYQFGSPEFQKSLKVFGWTMFSAVLVLMADYINMIEFPTQYVFVVPLVNTLVYSLKEFIADNREV